MSLSLPGGRARSHHPPTRHLPLHPSTSTIVQQHTLSTPKIALKLILSSAISHTTQSRAAALTNALRTANALNLCLPPPPAARQLRSRRRQAVAPRAPTRPAGLKRPTLVLRAPRTTPRPWLSTITRPSRAKRHSRGTRPTSRSTHMSPQDLSGCRTSECLFGGFLSPL